MTTSGTITYNLNAGQVVTEAMGLIGVENEGESALSAYDMNKGLTALAMMLKSAGIANNLWRYTEGTITPLLATASYALTAKARRVWSIRRRVSGNDVALNPISREEYFEKSNKTQTGTPLDFYYDRQRGTGTVYLWPTPDAAFVANGTLQMTYHRIAEDITSEANDLDVPQEWLETIVYMLADRLATSYPSDISPTERVRIGQRAQALFAALTDDDDEPTSVFLSPDFAV